jgi:ribosomal protein S18 acetylase RimI-like enzyme
MYKNKRIDDFFKQSTLNFSPSSSPFPSNLIEKSSSNTNEKHCFECGMTFKYNDSKSIELHSTFHNKQNDKVLKYSQLKFKNDKTIQSYVDGKIIVIDSIISSKNSIDRVKSILDYVDLQLGISESKENQTKKSIKICKYYLFVCNLTNQIVGFCQAIPIKRAYRINYINKNEFTFFINDDDESKGEDALCGINRIWVSSNQRRKGIASRLLDSVCFDFLFNRTLSPSELAFSDPTQFGQMLARKHSKTDHFLVFSNYN